MTIAALLLALAADPRIVYSKSFPGSVPAFTQVELERDGKLVYKEKPDDDQPVSMAIRKEEADAIFELAVKLDNFKRPLESGLKVAKMGDKSYRWEHDGQTYQQTFNYSTDVDAQALQEYFERITETVQHFFFLERTVKFDKLGVNKALLQLEAAWDRKRIIATDPFVPLLNRVVRNESYLNIARDRAAKLLSLFSAPPAETKP